MKCPLCAKQYKTNRGLWTHLQKGICGKTTKVMEEGLGKIFSKSEVKVEFHMLDYRLWD